MNRHYHLLSTPGRSLSPPHTHPRSACMELRKPGQWRVTRTPPLRARVYFSEVLGGETREREGFEGNSHGRTMERQGGEKDAYP